VKEAKGNPMEDLYARYASGRREGRFQGAYMRSKDVVQAIRQEIDMSRPTLARLSGVSEQWLRVLETTDTPISRKTIRAILDVYLRHAPGDEAERISKANGYIDALWEIAVLADVRKVSDKVEKNFRDLYFHKPF